MVTVVFVMGLLVSWKITPRTISLLTYLSLGRTSSDLGEGGELSLGHRVARQVEDDACVDDVGVHQAQDGQVGADRLANDDGVGRQQLPQTPLHLL